MTAAQVTVVVPTKDRAAIVGRTLDAIRAQEGVELEVVVVDDGSTDGTGEVLAAVADPRLRVVRHQRPAGLPAARNAGAAVAGAPWTAFCDDDDLWAPTKLAAQLHALTSSGSDWSVTGAVCIDPDLGLVGHHRLPDDPSSMADRLLSTNVLPAAGSSIVVRTSLLRDVGGFDEALGAAEDWDMWIRLAQVARFVGVDQPLMAYRIWPSSMSFDPDRMRVNRQAVVDKHADIAAERNVQHDHVGAERYLAKQLLRAGRGRDAAGLFARLALRHGRVDQLPRAALALVHPGLADRVGTKRNVSSMPAGWREQAEAWLAPLRQASAAVTP